MGWSLVFDKRGQEKKKKKNSIRGWYASNSKLFLHFNKNNVRNHLIGSLKKMRNVISKYALRCQKAWSTSLVCLQGLVLWRHWKSQLMFKQKIFTIASELPDYLWLTTELEVCFLAVYFIPTLIDMKRYIIPGGKKKFLDFEKVPWLWLAML